MVYSSVQNFTDAIRAEGMNLTTFTGDFFPMEELHKESFWTGYFSSRPNSKLKMREFSSYTTAASSLFALNWFVQGKH